MNQPRRVSVGAVLFLYYQLFSNRLIKSLLSQFQHYLCAVFIPFEYFVIELRRPVQVLETIKDIFALSLSCDRLGSADIVYPAGDEPGLRQAGSVKLQFCDQCVSGKV